MTTSVKVKKLRLDSTMPRKANETDAGFDLTATSILATDDYIEYGTGIALEMPSSHFGLLFSRSSISKYDLILANSVGVIDSGYRGEIKVRFKVLKENPKIYKVGDRIAQIVFFPLDKITLLESSDLSNSDRGNGGFGSSGV